LFRAPLNNCETQDSLTPISYSVAYKYVNNDRSIPAQEASIYPAKYNASGWQTPTGTPSPYSNAMIGTGSINTTTKTLQALNMVLTSTNDSLKIQLYQTRQDSFPNTTK
jgi:hypothetical protein